MADKLSDEQIADWANEAADQWLAYSKGEAERPAMLREQYIAHKAYAAGRESMREEVAKKTCNWKPEIDGEFWSGECGAAWTLNDAGPKENNMHYCPECGGQLEVSAAKEEGE